MEAPTWIISYAAALWVSTIIALLLLLLLPKYLRRRSKLNLPPGPKPWPIIGNLNLINATLPHRSIHHLSLKYGPIMQLQFGSYPVVVGSSAEMAKTFLKTMDMNFVDRPQTTAAKYTLFNNSDITLAPYGPYWRQARRICITELFSAKRLDSYEYIRSQELKSMLHKLNTASSSARQPILLRDYLSALSLNVISRMVLGKSYLNESEAEGENIIEFKKMLDELSLLNGALNIGDFIPWINFLDLQGYIKRMKALSKKFDRFLEHVIDEHNGRRVVEGEKFVAKDMVDVLLQLADDPGLEVKLERHRVKGITLTMLAGGTESSTLIVEWAMSELLKNPKVIKKATEELDHVVGQKRWVEEKDMPNLPYIQAIVNETMRLHPTAPMLVPRLCREDCKVVGYDIPKRTRILVSVWTISRDPTVWENPNMFNPDRFIGKDFDVKGGDFNFLPFGAGRRMCPGYSLGHKIILTSLANLLHGFNWKLTNDISPNELNMEEIFGLTTPKKIPLAVVIEPRLPMYVYSV